MMMRFWKTSSPSSDETQKEDTAVQTDGDAIPVAEELKLRRFSAPNTVVAPTSDTQKTITSTPGPSQALDPNNDAIDNGTIASAPAKDLAIERAAEPFPTIIDEDNGASSKPNAQAAETPNPNPLPISPIGRIRKLSLRSFAYFYGRDKADLQTTVENTEGDDEVHEPPRSPTPSGTKLKKERTSKADQRATNYAILLRSLIVGNPFVNGVAQVLPSASKSIKAPFKRSKPPLKKLKSELLKPSEANRVIAQLRNLPTPDASTGVLHGTIKMPDGRIKEEDIPVVPQGGPPIHGVCLDCTDDAADELHFSHLTSSTHSTTKTGPTPENAQTNTVMSKGKEKARQTDASSSDLPPSIATADLQSVVPMLRGLKLIDLVAAEDFGFGQPVGGVGILAGSIPAAMTVGQGLMEVGQQLLNLGFATSQAVLPSHKGIYPPKDRLSVLSYWWGYEIVIPPPSMKYLGNVKSISNSLLNFLTAFSLFNNGVREILPFIRYASQFIEFEWNAIKGQDKGKGVVCAATWVMPAALVPRPWDFEEPKPELLKSKGIVATTTTTTVMSQSGPTILSSMDPPPLPGTEIIILPANPDDPNPDAPLIPLVTLTPPMSTKPIEDTDEGPSTDITHP